MQEISYIRFFISSPHKTAFLTCSVAPTSQQTTFKNPERLKSTIFSLLCNDLFNLSSLSVCFNIFVNHPSNFSIFLYNHYRKVKRSDCKEAIRIRRLYPEENTRNKQNAPFKSCFSFNSGINANSFAITSQNDTKPCLR
jgi:hypothetical protein